MPTSKTGVSLGSIQIALMIMENCSRDAITTMEKIILAFLRPKV